MIGSGYFFIITGPGAGVIFNHIVFLNINIYLHPMQYMTGVKQEQ